MGKCEYESEKGFCTLNECMYSDFAGRTDRDIPSCSNVKDDKGGEKDGEE